MQGGEASRVPNATGQGQQHLQDRSATACNITAKVAISIHFNGFFGKFVFTCKLKGAEPEAGGVCPFSGQNRIANRHTKADMGHHNRSMASIKPGRVLLNRIILS